LPIFLASNNILYKDFAPRKSKKKTNSPYFLPTVVWVPKHRDIMGNRAADELARLVTTSPLSRKREDVDIPISSCRRYADISLRHFKRLGDAPKEVLFGFHNIDRDTDHRMLYS